MSELKINETKKQTITTLEIAEMMETSHKIILRKIDGSKDRAGYAENLTKHQMVLSDYFIPSVYKDNSGKKINVILLQNLDVIFSLISSWVKKVLYLLQNM